MSTHTTPRERVECPRSLFDAMVELYLAVQQSIALLHEVEASIPWRKTTLDAEPPAAAHGDHDSLKELELWVRHNGFKRPLHPDGCTMHTWVSQDNLLHRLAELRARPRAASPDAGALLRELREYIHGDAMPDIVQVSDWIDKRLDCPPILDDRAPQESPTRQGGGPT